MLRFAISFRIVALIALWFTSADSRAQTFALEHVSDTLSILRLGAERWPLPYPVYRFQTGDVNGDGIEEALVGVVKATRFYPEKARRLFVFKNYQGLIRPLWLGSRLGGVLHDFRYEDGHVVAIEECQPDTLSIGIYEWDHFGFKRK